MPDPACAGSVPLLFILGTAAAGLCLGLLGDAAVGRTLPHVAGRPTRAQKIATAVAAAALCALLAWRFGPAPELPAFILLAVMGI